MSYYDDDNSTLAAIVTTILLFLAFLGGTALTSSIDQRKVMESFCKPRCSGTAFLVESNDKYTCMCAEAKAP